MVFDWFTRGGTPAEPQPTAVEPSEAEPVEAGTPPQAPPVPDALAEPPIPASETPSSAAAGGVDQDALAWARQAYARLKAEQEAARQAQAPPTPPPQPVSPSPAVTAPPVTAPAVTGSAVAETAVAETLEPSELPERSEPAASPERPEPAQPPEAVESLSAEPPSAGLAQRPEPLAPVQPPEPAPAQTASLFELAAAQRQQRLQELLEAPEPAVTAVPAEVAQGEQPPGAAETSEVSEAEPELGAFDDTFTWSAEVLAAQGRRPEDISLEEIDWLGRLRRGLEKTRRGFVTQLLETFGDDPLTPEILDDLETTLLQADVGVQATDLVLEALRRRLNEEVVDPAEGIRFLKQQLRDLLDAPIASSGEPLLAPVHGRLNVWLMVGVNGVGKTTTLGKLANLAVRSGYSCLIAAADTFRAAAVQQVTVWGERSGVPVVANPSPHADPAAVVYDAIGAARAKGIELVLVDTAGRLQTKHNLMEELAKVRRIIDKLAPDAVVQSLLVLDASQGQNGLRQAMAFASAAGLTGVVLTKLDGSARGGVALAVAHEAGLPIRFVGAGEGIRDLRPFNSFEFVEALLAG